MLVFNPRAPKCHNITWHAYRATFPATTLVRMGEVVTVSEAGNIFQYGDYWRSVMIVRAYYA